MPQHVVILGGGLAGTFLATRLCHAGQRVTLIDDLDPKSASRVAAGMFNVITGRYGAKSWLADTLLQEIEAFFALPPCAEAKAHLHYRDIYRPFKTTEEYNKWTGRANAPEFAHLVDFQEQPLQPEQVINPHGGLMIRGCGWADTRRVIDGLQHQLEMHHHLRRLSGHLPYHEIDLAAKTVQLRGEKLPFDHLVCCEGHRLAHNPWFDFLRVIPNKGEILTIEAPELHLPFLLSKKIYLLPVGGEKWVCGATYANQFEDLTPSEAGRAEIESYLQKAIKVPYRVVSHWAGARPTTPNRRPIVGTHPEIPHLHVLGGFGSKGMLLGPYTSRLLTEQILTGQADIPPEAQATRFGAQ
jgi:glycine oxidase